MCSDINEQTLYYRTEAGKEFKLLPIKPLSEEEIIKMQERLKAEVNCTSETFGLNWDEEIICGAADDMFNALSAMVDKYHENQNLYAVCEMARRYLYMLTKQNDRPIPGQISIFDEL